jgi:glycosyltransferase involved in cell wall biosynthesis
MYRLAYKKRRCRVIIQNVEDRDYFVSRRVFDADDVRLIRGSGADVSRFASQHEADGPLTVVFASRMLREKGVEDFVRAAQLVRANGSAARFVLVGEPDHGNPHSHSREELEAWAADGSVEWWGFRSDMQTVFCHAHLVCLPTYYGEGVPKVLIEAAACARPIITTDTPGCRDIVRDEENGILIRPRDVAGLARAVERLLQDPAARRRMGQRGREIAEAEFSLTTVVGQTLDVYREFVG